jgi:hydroxymethylbilane synthase
MVEKKIKIGTRGSKLALWQANYLQNELLTKCLIESEIVIIETKGDQIQNLSFDKIEGKGFFTKELEDALLNKEVDMCVHSMKDLPTNGPKDLVTAGVSYREDCRDTLIIHKDAVDNTLELKLKQNAIVGSSSLRRKVQLKALRPDCILKDIRGNVPTRINKIGKENFDAIIIAKAGLERLQIDLSQYEVIHFHPLEFVPAPAQGVLAYQCRKEDIAIRKMIMKIHDDDVSKCTNVERKVLNLMEGGCHMPLGVHCYKDANEYYHVYAAYSKDEQSELKKIRVSQSTTHLLAETIVNQLKK